MDELKRAVPIWKKEHYAEGGEGWVEGTKLGL
jgi:molybdopterin synthase catalytic subunit